MNDQVMDLNEITPKVLKKQLAEADKRIPPSIWTALRKAFKVQGLAFFQFYVDMHRIRLGGLAPTDLKMQYKRAADRISQVKSPVDGRPLSPAAVNHIALTRPEINRAILRIQQDRMTPTYWGQFNAVMVPLMVEVAKDKGVYLAPTRQMGREMWATFRKMSAKQEQVEKLRDEDPEAYALMTKLGKTLEEIDEMIRYRIALSDQVFKRGFMAGRPVAIGVDKVTGEERVYTRDGLVLTKDEFYTKVRADDAARERLLRVPAKTQVPPEELRLFSDEKIEQLTGDIEWDAITDDKAKQGRLTRLFPTKRMQRLLDHPEKGLITEEFKVVVAGRYKGCYLDDLINSEGRLIEGTAYTYDRNSGKASIVPERIDPSEREPYVSVAEVMEEVFFQGRPVPVKRTKLYLKINGARNSAVLRNAIKALACNAGAKTGCVPSITYEKVEGSKAAGFYFDPKDFGTIMASLEGMSLSKAALDEVQNYYKDLAYAEAATRNLEAYHPEALSSEGENGERFAFVKGKFRKGEWQAFDLRETQRKAIAWMDAKNGSGVCALDTGVGKTTVSIGAMLRLIRDGFGEEDATYTKPDGTVVNTNGRFLFVCPTSLRGNIKKEVKALTSDPKVLLDRIDVLSYSQFTSASKSGKVPKSLSQVPFWAARKSQGQNKKARHAEVDRYGNYHAYWEYNSPVERVYGVYNVDTDDEVGRIIYQKMTHAWIVEDSNRKRLQTFSANDAREGVKRSLMVFSMARTAKKPANKPWDPALYVAIYFDEAHEMKNPSSARAQAALKLWHPRKVCLTASPMERNPMEAYVLAAITNNTPLFGQSIEAADNRAEMRRFKERFCEIVGGRIVGVKKDPLVQRDLYTWVKQNVFYADKTDVREYELPTPVITTTPVIMPQAVEVLYRDISSEFASVMRGAARKFTVRERSNAYEDRQAERVFAFALQPVMNLLTKMSNRPQEALKDIAFAIENGYLPGQPGQKIHRTLKLLLAKWQSQYDPEQIREIANKMGNPKLKAAEDFLASKLDRAQGSRALIFADDKDLCLEAGLYLSNTMPGTHVVALGDKIHFFRAGQELDEWSYPMDKSLLEKLVEDPEDRANILQKTGGISTHRLPFRKRPLRLHPALPGKQGVHDVYVADDWQQFVLKELVKSNSTIKTATLLGKVYSHGHNLQTFNTVIHLDRNNWNSETMKQRTARSWRQGQAETVDEVTFDMTYSPDAGGNPVDPWDKTLDEIRAAFQSMDAAIFDNIIKAAQGIELGAEWNGVASKDASLYRLDERVMEMMASPYMDHITDPDPR